MATKEELWSFEDIKNDQVCHGKLQYHTHFHDKAYKLSVWERKKHRFQKDVFDDSDVFEQNGVRWVSVKWNDKWLLRSDYKNWGAKKCVEEYLERVLGEEALQKERNERQRLRQQELKKVREELKQCEEKKVKPVKLSEIEDSDLEILIDSDVEILNSSKKEEVDSDIEVLLPPKLK